VLLDERAGPANLIQTSGRFHDGGNVHGVTIARVTPRFYPVLAALRLL
jgi:hypothetical protein